MHRFKSASVEHAIIVGSREHGWTRELRSPVDLTFAKTLDCGLRAQWRIVNFLEGVGARFGPENRQDLNVPMIVVVNGLPVTKALGSVQAIRRSVQNQVKLLCYCKNPLQGATQ